MLILYFLVALSFCFSSPLCARPSSRAQESTTTKTTQKYRPSHEESKQKKAKISREDPRKKNSQHPFARLPHSSSLHPAKSSKPFSTLPTIQPSLHGGTFWVQMFGALCALFFTIAMVYLTLRWLSKQLGLRVPQQQGRLKLCERLPLEPKKTLWLIEADGHHLLIATHEQGMLSLGHIEPDSFHPSSQQTDSFSKRLQTIQHRKEPSD